MKRIILVSILALAVLVAFVPISNAEMAKEGTTSGKITWIAHFTMLPTGKERVQINYEAYGVALSDTGEGLLHNASGYVVGSTHSFKGHYEDDSGSGIFTRPDGDKIFFTYKAAGISGKVGKGSTTYVGGTGKFAGIQGSGEFTRYMLQPIKKGAIGASLNISKSHWKIVEPKK
jgi:hypothetical protein